MYCSACGSPIAPGLSFCNRCGMSLKERGGSKPAGTINGLVTAMVIVGAAAMGMMLGGPIALKKEGQFVDEFIVLFMFLTFLIGLLTEVFLYRQLTRLTSDTSKTEHVALPPQSVALPAQSAMSEYRSPQPQRLPEPIPSVTENTTRTLEYSREERRK
jgi:predicted nucleic acid-binding Zn ribbon protein